MPIECYTAVGRYWPEKHFLEFTVEETSTGLMLHSSDV